MLTDGETGKGSWVKEMAGTELQQIESTVTILWLKWGLVNYNLRYDLWALMLKSCLEMTNSGRPGMPTLEFWNTFFFFNKQ